MIFRAITLLLVAMVLVWSLVQWSRTPASHPEHSARGDRARLVALILVGLCGETVRARYEANPLVVLWFTLALTTIAFAALYYSWRLYRAFRHSNAGGSRQTASASTTTTTRKP